MVPDLPSTDAVDNIQTLLAEVYAAVGFHTGDPDMLERARGLLWFVCRELAADGEWYYYGIGSQRHGQCNRSHLTTVLDMGMNTLAYLRAADVDVSDILPWFRLGLLHLNTSAAPGQGGFTHASAKLIDAPCLERPPAAGHEVTFTHWIRVHDAQARRVVLKDRLPDGFEQPAQMDLTLESRRGIRELSVTPADLVSGIELSPDCRVDEDLLARYTLRVADGGEVKQNPAGTIVIHGVERMRGPDAWVSHESATGFVQDYFKPSSVHGGNLRNRDVSFTPPIRLPSDI